MSVRLGSFASIPEAKAETWKLCIQEHRTVRQKGRAHYDLRLAPPGGPAFSWAIPKARLPKPGDRPLLAIRQEDHPVDYMQFSGRIEEGYGAGDVILKYYGDVDVIEAKPTKIWFAIHEGPFKGEYKLYKIPKGWLISNVTKTKETAGIKLYRPPYKEVKIDRLNLSDPEQVLTPKVDGAHVLIVLRKKDLPRVYSYRIPKRTKEGVIEHTFRYQKLLDKRVPPSLHGTVLRGELFARDHKGKPLQSKDVGGLLNASVPKSRQKQQQKGFLDLMFFDVERFKNRPARNLSYEEKLKIMEQVAKKLPIGFAPEVALTEEEKAELIKRIREGKHPDTKEGVVAWNLKTGEPPRGIPIKAKFRPEFDVYVRRIFTKARTKAKKMAGGFEYSWTPTGPIVGRVGTGFSHRLREDMYKHPEKYIGRVAKVTAQEVYSRDGEKGALRAPSFIEWHWEKNQ